MSMPNTDAQTHLRFVRVTGPPYRLSCELRYRSVWRQVRRLHGTHGSKRGLRRCGLCSKSLLELVKGTVPSDFPVDTQAKKGSVQKGGHGPLEPSMASTST